MLPGTVLGTAGFLQLKASRILSVLVAVRWPSGRRRRFAKPTRVGSHPRESRLVLQFPAEELPIAILSRPVPICCLSTRSLHNLLHSAKGLDREFYETPSGLLNAAISISAIVVFSQILTVSNSSQVGRSRNCIVSRGLVWEARRTISGTVARSFVWPPAIADI